MIRNILRALIPVMIGVAAAFVWAQAPSADASALVTVHVVRGNLIQTSQHLYVGEVLHLGLNGEAMTVTSEQGTTLAWLSPGFPRSFTGRTIVMSVS